MIQVSPHRSPNNLRRPNLQHRRRPQPRLLHYSRPGVLGLVLLSQRRSFSARSSRHSPRQPHPTSPHRPSIFSPVQHRTAGVDAPAGGPPQAMARHAGCTEDGDSPANVRHGGAHPAADGAEDSAGLGVPADGVGWWQE